MLSISVLVNQTALVQRDNDFELSCESKYLLYYMIFRPLHAVEGVMVCLNEIK